MCRQVVLPASSALGVVAGFGVLGWFALATPPSPGIHGLGAFPSAFLGDPVLLPVVAAILTLGVLALVAGTRDWLWGAAGALVGLAGGVATQLLWLADDHPATNWTFPAPHRFNAAGDWHAIYLCLTSALLSGLAVVLLVRLRRTARQDRRRVARLVEGPLAALLWMALLSYVALLVHDSSSGTFASRTSLVAVGVSAALCCLLALLALGPVTTAMARPVLLGLLTGVAVGLLVQGSLGAHGREFAIGLAVNICVAVALACLVLIPAGQEPSPAGDMGSRVWALTGSICVCLLLCAEWVRGTRAYADHNVAALLSVVVAELATVMLGYGIVGGWGRARRAADAVLALAVMIWIAGPVAWGLGWARISHIDVVVGAVLSAAVFWLAFPAVTKRFDVQITVEDKLGRAAAGRSLPPVARQTAAAAIAFLITGFVATALALLSRALETLAVVDYRDGTGWPLGALVILAFLAVATAAVALKTADVVGTRPKSGRARHQARRVAPVLFVPWCVALVATIDVDMLRHSPVVAIILVVTSSLCAWWAGNSLLNNVFLLRVRRVDPAGWVLVLLGAVATGLSAYWAGSQALIGRDHSWATLPSLVGALAVLAMQGALTVAIGRLAAPSAPTMTLYGLAHNLSQDALVIALLHTFAVVLPLVFLAHLNGGSGSDHLLNTLAVCVPALTLLGCAYRWTVKNNTSHVEREIDAKASDPAAVSAAAKAESGARSRLMLQLTAARQGLPGPRRDRFLRVLSAHAHTQNFIGTLLLIPLIVGVLALIQERSSGTNVPRRD
jgi:hypothetical protein